MLTGAGVSAASGVPTFRGPGGLWKDFRPEELATAEAFARDPKTVWEWYDWRRQLVAKCLPNRAHEVLALWSRRYESFALVTQNVDGLHERAGTRERHPVPRLALGSLLLGRMPFGLLARRDGSVSSLPPPCPHCGGPLRPGVVWFGEAIPAQGAPGGRRALSTATCA